LIDTWVWLNDEDEAVVCVNAHVLSSGMFRRAVIRALNVAGRIQTVSCLEIVVPPL
jgi:hypothetical protein